MFWSRQLSTSELIELCRALRYALSGGMMLRDAMALLAREGSGRLRRASANLAQDLKAGWSMQEAMDKQAGTFPPLFRALATVGEETGNLPEVMGELEKYYITRQKLRRDFIGEISWPLIQFFAAVLIVGALIIILDMIQITSGRGNEPVDPIGLGLRGVPGAVTFLAYVFGGLLVLWGTVKLISYTAARVPRLQRIVFRIPVLGPCLRALALTRLCIALRLMLDTRMSVLKAIRLAFTATDNSAFIAAASQVEGAIRRGNTIADSFGETAVIPPAFRSAVAVAEESGRLPEMCAVQAENYDEQARSRLSTLNKFASVAIWLGVAAFIIMCIINIFNNVYLKNLNDRLDPTGQPTLNQGQPPAKDVPDVH
jgi:type II secretory pathway component PulF